MNGTARHRQPVARATAEPAPGHRRPGRRTEN